MAIFKKIVKLRKKIKEKINENRNSTNLFWRFLVLSSSNYGKFMFFLLKRWYDLKFFFITLLGWNPFLNFFIKNKKKMLVVHGKAGMGERILVVLAGIVYSRITGRSLIVEWNDGIYSQDKINVFHKFFKSPDIDPTLKIPHTKSVIPYVWHNNWDKTLYEIIGMFTPKLGLSYQHTKRYSINLAKDNYHEQVAFMHDDIFRWRKLKKHLKKFPKEWQNLNKEALMKKLLTEHLFLNSRIKQQIDKFKQRHFKDTIIGVHIRYTDNIYNRYRIKKGFLPSLHKYPKIINKILKNNPSAQIFLATDNKRILKDYQNKYKKIITTKKWYPKKIGNRIHGHFECPDRIQAGIDALIDMYLLSYCNYLVFSGNSLFPYISKLLSRIDDSRIFDVETNSSVGSLINPI